MLIKIENDVLDIVARLREIKPSYGVVFNTETQLFEVTDGGESVLRLPYDALDERAIRRAWYTRFENIDTVIKDIEKSNEKSDRERIKRAQDGLEDGFSRAMRLN